MLDTVVRIGSPDEGEAEVNIAKESGRARFDQQPMSLSMSGGFNMNPEAASTYTQEPQLPGAADSAIVAKSIQAKSLPMASTNPMPNPPAVGAGYNAARKGSNGAASSASTRMATGGDAVTAVKGALNATAGGAARWMFGEISNGFTVLQSRFSFKKPLV